MAFNLKHVIATLRLQKDVATGYSFPREGVVASAVIEAGVEKVRPSLAAGSEVVVGFVVSDSDSRTDAVLVETITVPASPYAVQLKKTILVGAAGSVECGVREGATPYTQVANTGAINSATKFFVDPATGLATFHSGALGKVLTVSYRYQLTALEKTNLDYARSPSNTAGATLGTVTVVAGSGEIYTQEFDASQNWAAASPTITTGANGEITIGGAGTTIAGVRIIKLPDVDDPSLGLAFNF